MRIVDTFIVTYNDKFEKMHKLHTGAYVIAYLDGHYEWMTSEQGSALIMD